MGLHSSDDRALQRDAEATGSNPVKANHLYGFPICTALNHRRKTLGSTILCLAPETVR